MVSAQPALEHWVQQQLGDQGVTLQPLQADASRRRYFRVKNKGKSYIAADASKEKTDLPVFVANAKALAELRITVPDLYAVDLLQGYLLESDLGDVTLYSIVNADNVAAYYASALSILAKLQTCNSLSQHYLPRYDLTLMTREWNVFTTWYLQKYHQLNLDAYQPILDNVFNLLLATFSEQPQVYVHRDYHSRNLMVQSESHLAVIDFQGARRGPITYDLVSLLKDCYLTWPAAKVQAWALGIQDTLWQQVDAAPVSSAQFLRWFDLTGLQRHLKVLGQFARQSMAGKNTAYMKDLPRVQQYVLDVCQRYDELQELRTLIEGLA